VPSLKSVIRINDKDTHLKGFVNFTDINPPAKSSLLKYNVDPHDPINIQFTSGTTGRPKAATLSHFNILNNAYAIGNKCRYTLNDNIAVPVPFYHCFGMIMGTLAALVRGGSITIVC
jgi:fatty-acyl-CoA synthase